jgi:hypothetical protein
MWHASERRQKCTTKDGRMGYQNGSCGDYLGGGLNSNGQDRGLVVCCECSDEPLGSGATELVSCIATYLCRQ